MRSKLVVLVATVVVVGGLLFGGLSMAHAGDTTGPHLRTLRHRVLVLETDVASLELRTADLEHAVYECLREQLRLDSNGLSYMDLVKICQFARQPPVALGN